MECRNQFVRAWLEECILLTKPVNVEWVFDPRITYEKVTKILLDNGTFHQLDANEYPNSFWCRSNPQDVARVEDRTFICSVSQSDAGPLNNWCSPVEMKDRLHKILSGSMRGRTMYIIPYIMGPEESPYSKVGFEVTDSPYVVANMIIMARVGDCAIRKLGDDSSDFVKGLHAVCEIDPQNRYIAHFPEDREIISVNTNYGGNALLGKKCFALRIASVQARDERWLAEHMLILGITEPSGRKTYISAAFPSACGKTNLAMMVPPESYLKAGWKVETVGDDIAWLNLGPDGRLYAINPESGFFGVAPGTSVQSNPNAISTLHGGNTIFTNTGYSPSKKLPWWEGLDKDPPDDLIDWLGNPWTSDSGTPAAHPNSRFTTPARQAPCISDDWENPRGVPISAIIFGGRRAKAVPLIYEAMNWIHGTYIGSTVCSETTAAASGALGVLRRDPMAMRPFIGYHAGDYFAHWLEIGKLAGRKAPNIFHVNWFRKNTEGKYLWPGFSDNMRVLEWIVKRLHNEVQVETSPLGHVPLTKDLNLDGLKFNDSDLEDLMRVDPQDWNEDLKSQEDFFNMFGAKMPSELWHEYHLLRDRLGCK